MILIRAILFLGLLCQVGCAPYFYRGEFAALVGDDSMTTTRIDKELGDCYRVLSGLPTVHEISRPNYTLHVAHGTRYWPQLYFAAESNDRSSMEIIGAEIEPVRYGRDSDHQRTEEVRGMQFSHQSVRLDYVKSDSIQIAILDSQWGVIGIEELTYDTLSVKCFSWDAI